MMMINIKSGGGGGFFWNVMPQCGGEHFWRFEELYWIHALSLECERIQRKSIQIDDIRLRNQGMLYQNDEDQIH
jgi:hypothetical protein